MRNRSEKYWLNDINRPLSRLLSQIVNEPEEVAGSYASVWKDRDENHLEQFYLVREEFNQTQNPTLLLYLLARCVKGSVRYNADGNFNQSPDKRRLGTNPLRMRRNILTVSALLKNRSIFTSLDYSDVFSSVDEGDIVYMDPPYQGVCGDRDQRYSNGIEFDRFVGALDLLNRRKVKFLVSYDGRLGDRSYGEPLPGYLDLALVEIEAGRSSQATLLGRDAITVESLYLSRTLADEIGVTSTYISRIEQDQLCLFEMAGEV